MVRTRGTERPIERRSREVDRDRVDWDACVDPWTSSCRVLSDFLIGIGDAIAPSRSGRYERRASSVEYEDDRGRGLRGCLEFGAICGSLGRRSPARERDEVTTEDMETGSRSEITVRSES